MAKLTKKQRNQLYRVLSSVGAAHEYLHQDRTAICHVASHATTTLHRPPSSPDLDDRILLPVEKYGSDLVRLSTGLDLLSDFLEEHT